MAIYYFGYGSNMSQSIMRSWCPNYQLIGAAYLDGWQLALTRYSQRWGAGVADVVVASGHRVWGGLYRISDSDLHALDIKESNGQHYQRIQCTVNTGEQQYDCVTYSVINKATRPVPTSTAYRETMLTGARELRLPEDYIEYIMRLPVSENSP